MGTLVGHVAPGLGFFLLGLWHLFNHIKLHALHPNSYKSHPWFPSSKVRYLELCLIMAGCTTSVAMELFIGPEKHQPLNSDGTIPLNHLHNLEHAQISLTFFVYAAFAIVLDWTNAEAQYGLTQLLGTIAFGQELLLFHLHSADHVGMEGQYHLLLQLVILISLTTTLMGSGLRNSFLVSFVRSASIMFQGVWLITMGFMLWTPEFMPKGCFINSEDGHKVARCHTAEALHRAKSLVNIEFGWFLILATIFLVSLYLVLVKIYGGNVEYQSLVKGEEFSDDNDDIEAAKNGEHSDRKGFVHSMKPLYPINMGR